MTATTATTIIDQTIDDVEGIAWKFTGTATSGGATLTTTDAEINKLGANYNADRFNGHRLWIPTGTSGTDDIHTITSMSVSAATTTITTLGNYGATYTNAAMYIMGPHPNVFLRHLNDALELAPVEAVVPLRHGPDDADVQTSATTSWTGTNCTVAKQTTAAEVLWGQRSMSLTLTSASGYATSTTVRAGHSEQVYGFALAKADIGTGIFRLLDNGGNTLDSVSFTQEDWLYVRKSVSLGSDDEGVVIRILGTDNLDQIDVQAAWVVRQNINRFQLPSWIDERFKLKGIEVACFRQAGSEDDTWLAQGVDTVSLTEGVDYRYINRQADANPYWVEILPPAQHYMQYPMFLTVDCPASAPYGVSATFSAVTDTTNLPQKVAVAAFKCVLGRAYKREFPTLQAEAEAEFRKLTEKRVTAKASTPQWAGPTGGVRI
jgi:hypothetical protein